MLLNHCEHLAYLEVAKGRCLDAAADRHVRESTLELLAVRGRSERTEGTLKIAGRTGRPNQKAGVVPRERALNDAKRHHIERCPGLRLGGSNQRTVGLWDCTAEHLVALNDRCTIKPPRVGERAHPSRDISRFGCPRVGGATSTARKHAIASRHAFLPVLPDRC